MLEYYWTDAHQIGPTPITEAMELEYDSPELGHMLNPNANHPAKKNQFLLLDEGKMT